MNDPIAVSPSHAAQLPVDSAALLAQIIETQNDISQVELDSATLMKIIAERTQKLTGADGAVLELVEGDRLVFKAVSGLAQPYLGMSVPIEGSLSGHCYRTGEIAYCSDTATDPRVYQPMRQQTEIRSMILVPLHFGGKQIGILKMMSLRTHAFSDENIRAMQLMAGLLGAALEHAHEFEVKKKLLEERTGALAALRQSEERFRSAFDYAAIGKALVALDGRFTQVNRSLCEMLGYSEAELLATNYQSLTHPEDLDADLKFQEQLFAGGIPHYQMNKRYFHKQGHIVAAQLSVSLLRDESGKPLHFISQVQDLTQSYALEEALRTSEAEHRAMFELAGVGKAHADLATGRFLKVNQKFCDLLGYTAAEAASLTFLQITPLEDREPSRAVAEGMLRGEIKNRTMEKRYRRKNGDIMWASVNVAAIQDPTGKPVRAVATIVDITDRKLAEIFERDRSRTLEMILQDSPTEEVLSQLAQTIQRQIPDAPAGFMLIRDGRVVILAQELSDPWQAALSRAAMPLSVKLTEQAWDSMENLGITFPRKDPIWENLRALAEEMRVEAVWTSPIKGASGEALGLLTAFCKRARQPSGQERRTLDTVAKLAAVAMEHRSTQQLAHWVRHDALTGLPNRIKFEDQIDNAIAAAAANQGIMALLMVDIDHFKAINDTHGHHAGDHLLQLFAQRLKTSIRGNDAVARLGGDEFGVILTELGHADQAIVMARRIVEAMQAPFDLPGAPGTLVTASIGIATYPQQAEDAVKLRDLADTAMYRAKSNGRNQCHI